MTKLIFVRHGQSIANKNRYSIGQTDIDLSETGYMQADLTAMFLRNEHVDAIYSSDLCRAYNTVKPLAEIKGIEIIKTKELREINIGICENIPTEVFETKYEPICSVWRSDNGNAAFPGGESVKELYSRIVGAVKRIAEDNDGKTIVIGTHATPIRIMMTCASGYDYTGSKHFKWVGNASITVFEYENGKFNMSIADYTDHLGGLTSTLD